MLIEKKLKDGSVSYEYKFMVKGKLFKKTFSKDEMTKDIVIKNYDHALKLHDKIHERLQQERAKELEQEKQEQIKEKTIQETLKEKEVIIAFHESKIAEQKGIKYLLLDDVVTELHKKPKYALASKKLKVAKTKRVQDFLAFVKGEYGYIKSLNDVTFEIAEDYFTYIILHGKYEKMLTYTRILEDGTSKTITTKNKIEELSFDSVNKSLQALNEMYNLFIVEYKFNNPFANVDLSSVKKKSQKRENFTAKEVSDILSSDRESFCFPLFFISFNTSLRLGDCCCLKWSDIKGNFTLIKREQLKTKIEVTIPILPELKAWLKEQKTITKDSEYILPIQAQNYIKDKNGVSKKIKAFLDGFNIQTSIKEKETQKARINKDFHSCRHTFAFNMANAGYHPTLVKEILGHTRLETTMIYFDHLKDNELINKLENATLYTDNQKALEQENIIDVKPIQEQEKSLKDLVNIASSLSIEQQKDLVKIALSMKNNNKI